MPRQWDHPSFDLSIHPGPGREPPQASLHIGDPSLMSGRNTLLYGVNQNGPLGCTSLYHLHSIRLSRTHGLFVSMSKTRCPDAPQAGPQAD